jgi:hypothetical protein
MAEVEPDLEKLSTKELHDRAIHLAERRLDLGFLWSLVEMIPAAEAAAGNVPGADADVMSVRRWLSELTELDEGPLGESLRPVYIDYLSKHAG